WAAAQIVPTSYQADGGHGLTTGVIGLCNKGKHRNPTDWGALRAWGWGASKMIDYFEKDALFDATKVAIEGVSRYGKASLVAMAFDERIAAGFICSSGKGGANGWRRDCGESVGNLAGEGEYHWMAGNFIKYSADNLTANDMKIDQHEFIALCAPRPCFISVGTWDADKWQDIMGMFMMTVKATPVYELLGKKGLDTNMLPQVDFGLLDGTLVYRQHHGGHEAGPNWPFFLDFFEREVVKR
ncbi:MAG: acetylxylan esterase, partial [Bacteroidales bacterium]|nr:acetylxylan esterase [Bacteroidales bacterium]